MTIVKGSCPDCGDQEMRPADLSLVGNGQQTIYSFVCPSCGQKVTKPLDNEEDSSIINSLIDIGLKIDYLPLEYLEIKSGPPLTHDDLLYFRLELDKTDLFLVD